MWYNSSMQGIFHRKKDSFHLVVDVGSHVIKAIIFAHDLTRVAAPRAVKKLVLKLSPDVHGRKADSEDSSHIVTQTRVVMKLRELMFVAVKELGQVPQRIVVGLGLPFVGVELADWIFPVSKIGSAVSCKDFMRFYRELEATHSKDENQNNVAYPADCFVNGYRISCTDQIRLQIDAVRELKFRVLLLRFSEEIGARIFEMKSSFGGMPIELVPLVAAQKTSMIRVFNLSHAFFIDIGGEVTVLALWRDGVLLQISSFSIGAQSFSREVKDTLSLSWETSEQMVRQYTQGLINEKQKGKLQEIIVRVAGQWENAFLASLDSFYHQGVFPQEVMVAGGGAHIPEIISAIRKPEWLRNHSYVEAPMLRILSGSSLFSGDSVGGFLQGADDFGLAALMTYALHPVQPFE